MPIHHPHVQTTRGVRCARYPASLLLLTALWVTPTVRSSADQVPALSVGAPMEDFGLRELDVVSGQLKRLVWLSDYVGPGARPAMRAKLVLLNFFANWCQPCLAEMPALSQLQARYRSDGLQVLSVNFRRSGEPLESTLTATRRLLAGSPPGFPLLFDRYTNRAQLLYLGSQSVLPCNILIDQQGVVRARLQGGSTAGIEELEARVRALLGLPQRDPAP